jgi:hypothetical protein
MYNVTDATTKRASDTLAVGKPARIVRSLA